MQALGTKLDGFDAEDLHAVVDRALHAALLRHLNSNTGVTISGIPILMPTL